MPHFSFIRSKQFFPLFIAQALGAFNDNFYRNAMAVLITYRLSESLGIKAETLISLAAAVFILPFFLFSAVAGQLADRVAKHILVRQLKLAECVLCGIAALSLFLGDPAMMLGSLFLLGTQAAVFGPVKYAILPELLPKEQLLKANAFVEAGTFLAILTGTLMGGLLVLSTHGLWVVSATMLVMSAVGYGYARLVPVLAAPAATEKASWNVLTSTWRVLRDVWKVPALLRPVLGISWFWALGAVYLTQFPVFVKQVFGANEEVVTLFFATFSIAIAFGSWASAALCKGRGMKTALLALAIFGCDLWWTIHTLAPSAQLIGLQEFLAHPQAARTLFDITCIAIAGGIFVVPLYTSLQLYAEAGQRARVIAANNLMNSLCITLTSVATVVCYQAGMSVQDVFLGVALLSVLAAIPVWLRRAH